MSNVLAFSYIFQGFFLEKLYCGGFTECFNAPRLRNKSIVRPFRDDSTKVKRFGWVTHAKGPGEGELEGSEVFSLTRQDSGVDPKFSP